jgi:flagellar hook protein FlgE
MNNLSSIALSGLNAASARLGVSAHNIANAQTDGFRRQQLLQSSVPGGGVTTSIGSVSQPGSSLIDDVVGAKMAAYGFKANVLVLQTQDRMLGSLLDLQA